MSKVKLSQKQIETVINNICSLRKLKKPKELFNGKPKWSDDIIKKYNYEKFGKFADNYTVLLAEGKEKSLNQCFILVDIGKSFEKYTILACANLLHLFQNYISPNQDRPMVSICFTSDIQTKQLAELNTPIFTFPYRFIVLPSLYFICGSMTQIGSLTDEYELFPYEKTYNGKEYSVIFSNDPLIIALNGVPGELFKYSQILFDSGVYKTIFIKLIQKKPKNPDLQLNALCEDLIIGLN